MIQKAIIESVESDGYHFKVRIPAMHKIAGVPGATSYEELPLALVCFAPGCKPNLSVGDVVYVGFENGQYSEPVILGMLLNDSSVESTASIQADSFNVSHNAELPSTGVKLGDLSLNDILLNINNISNSSSSGGDGDLTVEELEKILAKIVNLYV